MTRATKVFAAAAGLVGIGAAGWVAAELRPLPAYSFMGIQGSPAARILSRLIIDHADSAFHGGATHDVRFEPETGLGRMILAVSGGRGESGSGGRMRGESRGMDAYSQNVGKWVRFARHLDPGNFDALLTECHYITEGVFAVEVESEGSGGEMVEQKNIEEGEKQSRKRQSAKAIHEFFAAARLSDKTSLYNAAVAVQMLNEVEPWKFGIRKEKRMNKVLALVDLFLKIGDECKLVLGSTEDSEAAKKFAVAVRENIKSGGSGGWKSEGKKTPFTNGGLDRIISP